jgi:hypothetical protein
MDEHLRKNKVDLASTSARLGATLSLDPTSGRLTGEFATAAAREQRREYRKPFVIPDLS